ncbi:MAG: hypothetical protein MI785_25950 [Kiloniellales bacterium]|nr:hypothetical protein [Kiloniellales bacterium]
MAAHDESRAGLLERAARDWAWLRALAEGGTVKMTDWERALVFILSAATEAAREERAAAAPDGLLAEGLLADGLLERGRALVDRVARNLFEPGALHQDIKAWRKVLAAIESEGADADLPDIDFMTVE